MEIEKLPSTAAEFQIDGRRIVNISYLFRCIQEINKHEPFNCGFSEMQIIGENQDGLISRIKLQCKMCNIIQYFKILDNGRGKTIRFFFEKFTTRNDKKKLAF